MEERWTVHFEWIKKFETESNKHERMEITENRRRLILCRQKGVIINIHSLSYLLFTTSLWGIRPVIQMRHRGLVTISHLCK